MSKYSLAMEAMGMAIILVLLYANIFEMKQHTRKRRTFTQLLIANGIVIAADAVTWLNLDWKEMPALLGALVAVTYIVPFFAQAIFTGYLYEHISEKSETSRKPFAVIHCCSAVAGIIYAVLCAAGKLFTIEAGKFVSGPMESYYYITYILSLVMLSLVVLTNGKKLGLHDLLASLLFCFVPMAAILISMSDLGISVAVPSMALDMLIIYVLIQCERENELLYQSNNDELTGLFNRRAYEDDMMHYPDVPPEQDFIYVSADMNGLKQVNDTLGHAAGDELICGAAYCLKRTFGNYGRVYRTGGDEFVAMFFTDEKHLQQLLDDLKDLTDGWHGKQTDALSIAVGYASKREFPTQTVEQMSRVAEKRMYEEKERYYANLGVDRRGQNEAHKVLCSLYAKILKINLTSNSFAVVNMNLEEQTKERGYSNRISEWLEGFGKTGYVHPDDLEEYLAKTNIDYMRGYFKRRKTSLTVLYRRKYDDGFKQVVMEIIPANDYTDESQSLFLYVKNIDI